MEFYIHFLSILIPMLAFWDNRRHFLPKRIMERKIGLPNGRYLREASKVCLASRSSTGADLDLLLLLNRPSVVQRSPGSNRIFIDPIHFKMEGSV